MLDPPEPAAPPAPPGAPPSTTIKQLAILGEIAALAVIVAGSLAAFVPIAPVFPTAALDSAWAFALNVAIAKGLVFGRDIVFTFGPYAPAYTAQYHPATDALALWSSGLCGAAFAGSLLCLSRGRGRWGAAVLAVFLVLVPRDTLFLALPIAFVLVSCRACLRSGDGYRIDLQQTARITLGLLAAALALSTIVKGTFVFPALCAVVLGATVLALRGHAALGAAYAAGFAACVPLLWTAAGQPAAALPGYFAAQVPIVSGYTDAMAIPGVGGHPSLFAAGALALGLIYARFIGRAGLAGTAIWIGLALLVYLSFKAGFVRADWHVAIAAGTLTVAAWLLALGTPRPGGAVGVVVALVVWAILVRDETGQGPGTIPQSLNAFYTGTLRSLVERLTAPERLVGDYQESLSVIRSAQLLPEIAGSVDVYSYGQPLVLARNLDWAPRPVLQSYSAYTAELERLDAEHLVGRKAPATVLFSVQPIDGRLPALEDGLSWPLLLTRYRLSAVRADMVVLRRLSQPSARNPIASTTLAGSGTYALGQPIPVPQDVPEIWARIAVTPTPLGRLVSLAYKTPELTIAYEFADGGERRFRFIPQMGATGFVVSPLVETTTDFAALEAPAERAYFAQRRPTAIVISAAGGAGTLWATGVQVEFTELRIPPAPISTRLFDRVATGKRSELAPPSFPDCAVDVIDRPHGSDPAAPLEVGRFLRAIAWVATPDADAAPDAATFTLETPTGKRQLIRARAIPRGDVGGYFDLPPLSEATFTATADLFGRPGSYLLGLDVERSGQHAVCATQVPIRVVAPTRVKLR